MSHSILSPSTAHRWLECTPSALLEAKVPNESSIYAEEGTLAHEIAALQLNRWCKDGGDKEFYQALHAIERHPQYQHEMNNHASNYVDYIINEFYTEDTRNIMVEQSLSLDPYVPNCRGTADCIIDNGSELVIIDFKYGKGVKVSATANPQLMLYALGALLVLDPEAERIRNITAVIYQPRISQVPSTTHMSAQSLLQWANTTVRPQAEKALRGEGETSPSEQACRFCRAKSHCAGLAKQVFADVDEILQPPVSNIAELSINQVAEYLTKFGLVKQWFDAAEERVKDALNQGNDVPGWKIVESRSIRKVTDQGLAVQRLKTAGFLDDQILKTSLVSLTEIEKLIGKKNVPIVLDGCITKMPGNPTLVQSSDPRPPMTPLKETILNAF